MGKTIVSETHTRENYMYMARYFGGFCPCSKELRNHAWRAQVCVCLGLVCNSSLHCKSGIPKAILPCYVYVCMLTLSFDIFRLFVCKRQNMESFICGNQFIHQWILTSGHVCQCMLSKKELFWPVWQRKTTTHKCMTFRWNVQSETKVYKSGCAEVNSCRNQHGTKWGLTKEDKCLWSSSFFGQCFWRCIVYMSLTLEHDEWKRTWRPCRLHFQLEWASPRILCVCRNTWNTSCLWFSTRRFSTNGSCYLTKRQNGSLVLWWRPHQFPRTLGHLELQCFLTRKRQTKMALRIASARLSGLIHTGRGMWCTTQCK